MSSTVKISQHPYSFCLKNRSAFYCLLALVVQQLIVASSTLWIVRLSRDVVLGTNFSTNLFLYLASLILPYLPAAVMSILLVTWEQSTLRKYIYLFISANTHHTNLWSDKKKREEFISTVNHEGSQTINQAVNYYYGLTSAGLNTILNILTISFLVDYLFLISYSASLVLSFILIKLQSIPNKKLVARAQNSRIELGKSILSFWDNVVLGNVYNLKFWKKNTDARIHHAVKDNVSASAFRELISIGISVSTFLPSLVVAAYGMYQHIGNSVALAVFVVIMPRLFLILSYTYNLLYLVTQFGAMKTRVKTILNVVEAKEISVESSYAPRIDWQSIHIHDGDQINGHSVSFDAVTKMINRPGRITIRGKNGSGKSSLLLELKRIFKEDAFYLPNQNHLHFSFGEVGRSTGELLKEQLEEIYRNVEARIILLDEWDANLDGLNQNHLSQLIDQIARVKCVIEVRHR
jgi:ABC-type bacteriocin/lantibiotic exporter with double-glycine peptidase domain